MELLVNMFTLGFKGRELILSAEGLRLDSYLDSAHVWTIGYGTTKLNGASVAGGMTINKSVAVALFLGEAEECVSFIKKCVLVSLNQNQIDALCSFVYNLGKQAFVSSSLLIAINAKMIINEDLFTRWNKVTINGQKVVLDGLTARRKREYDLFMNKEL